ncbi:DNA/RNA helicase [Rathayibacter rathayi]|uniref:DEAD/DEAH box helicase n=1 Tax=Rathayibacter rathayi TaxID=33887 RepID=UPI000CE92D63|nr:DEAD/DEAH box helicase [Rathayibacter rathayi]PPF82343.1 DNA/RNA helicase [Rathayibacter rathayi]PPG15492.1 DNA/RNA helicase [Rathayibacter rathayi]PPG46116.1 DNA/RNA helicase [Rathayibacter rathayi]PPH38420.1 DNA/RNA helicase [Rathayibacter rathayi]PPI04257.1 DNA/RNA helicase [Rathayibacter rathayi]
MPPESIPSSWRTRVGELSGSTEVEASPVLTPIGLQFELRRLVRRADDPWRAPSSQRVTAKGYDPAERRDHRLATRPVVRGRGGPWNRTTLTWKSLNFQTHRLSLDPAHQRWFAEFAALHQATRTVHLGQDPDWIHLDDYESPLLWRLLEQAPAVGVPLLAPEKGTVRLSSPAHVAVTLTAEEGALRLRPVLRIGGAEYPLESARPVARHGVYAVEHGDPSSILLAPAPLPFDDEEVRLLDHPEQTSVPAEDVPEFVREHLPALRGRIALREEGVDLVLDEPEPPRLVCTVAFEPRRTVRVGWHWRRTPDRATELDGTADDVLERAVLRRVRSVLGEAGSSVLPEPGTSAVLRGAEAAVFVVEQLPQLEGVGGVRVEREGAAPDYRLLNGPLTLTITAVDTESADWFDLGVVVTIGDATVPFLPLFRALAAGGDRIRLVDHSYLSLAHPGLERLRELLARADELDEWETGPRLGRHQTELWSELAELADESVASDAWRDVLASALAAGSPGEVKAPTGLTAQLRPYQRAGYAWLVHRLGHGLGGILADDMGLGKTLQALAMMLWAVQEGRRVGARRAPFLVVAPTSVVPGWRSEAERFAPGLRLHVVASSRESAFDAIPEDVDVVLTSYAVLRLAGERWAEREWSALILDEAQFVKNPASQTHRAAGGVGAPVVLALTGTPLENSLDELWAILALVAPGLLPPLRRFREEYTRPILHAEAPIGIASPDLSEGRTVGHAEGARRRLERLRRRLRPFLLRRTKEAVAPELPEKQEQTLEVVLTPAHRVLYDGYLQRERRKLLGMVDDLDRQRFTVFRSLTLLRLLALDASLVDPAYRHVPSAKLDLLVEQLDDVLAEGRKALVFSTFTSYLERAGEQLRRRGIPFVQLDGSTRDRAGVIEEFRSGAAPVFLISLKAGGTGLTLTEADHVFVLDPWWNPAAEAQAVDRAHRIGQERRVNVYRLVATDTIEEKIVRLQERKGRLSTAVLDEGELFARALTADDVRELLAD